MNIEISRSKLRNFILENYLFTDDTSALNDADSFLDKGILDSMGILEVIAFLKDEFNITVADSEVVPENLDSIENLCKFAESKI